MRKGYLLVELLCVIAMMATFCLFLNKFFRTIAGDVPRMHYVIEENSFMQDLLDQLQHDVDVGRSLQQEPAGADPNYVGREPIIIELPDSTVRYQQKDDIIERRIIKPPLPVPADPNQPDPAVITWPLHRAKIRWRLWSRDGEAYALEIKTHVEYDVGYATKDLLANARVFFLDAHPPERIGLNGGFFGEAGKRKILQQK